MYAKKEFVCQECDTHFVVRDRIRKFCRSSCAAKYSNKNRKISEEQKEKTSNSLVEYWDQKTNINKGQRQLLYKERCFWNRRKKRNSKHFRRKGIKVIENVFDLCNRTRIKVLKRLNLSCSYCGWNESSGDLHHIFGRKILDPNRHTNLSYLCPCCHRKAQNGKILPSDLITFEEQVGDKWKIFYYGDNIIADKAYEQVCLDYVI